MSTPVVLVERQAEAAAGWARLAFVFALIAAAAVAYYVAHIPIQVSDSVGNLLKVQASDYRELFVGQLFSAGYLRPLLWIQTKLAYDLAQGHEWLMFKGIHVGQLLVTAVLFVRLLRVRDATGLAATAVGVAVLFGLHTFNGTVREAFPINTFLTMVVCVLAAANLSISRPRLVNDLAALLLLVFAAMTVESGLLVAVAVVAGWIAGLRGISTRGVAACVLVAVAYFYLRFSLLAVGLPGLIERASGYGLAVLEVEELQARFGDAPFGFYAYNVAASLLTVLFSEPRGGVWLAVRGVVTDAALPAWLVLNLVTSAAMTGLAVVLLVRAVRRWRRDAVAYGDRLALVAVLVIGANAAIGFAYTKDVIMSVGGVFYALLGALAVDDVLRVAPRLRAPVLRGALVAVLVLVSAAWTVRASALPFLLRQTAFDVRNDWAVFYRWLDGQGLALTTDEARALVEKLRTDALTAPLPHPDIGRPAYVRYLDLN